MRTDGANNEAYIYAGPNNSVAPNGLLVDHQQFGDTPDSFGPFTIPGSGDLFVQVEPLGEDSIGWSVSVTTTSGVPEPSTVATVGLGRRAYSGPQAPQAAVVRGPEEEP
jgi:hypothetical protein